MGWIAALLGACLATLVMIGFSLDGMKNEILQELRAISSTLDDISGKLPEPSEDDDA